jgi:hypothetical protein
MARVWNLLYRPQILVTLKPKVMKRIFTLLISTVASLSLFAFNGNRPFDGSRLSISAPSTSSQLKVEIDGREFTMKDNSITIGYLGEGSHMVKIYREGRRNSMGFGRRNFIFNSSIFLKRGFHTDITINRFGKVMQDEQRIDPNDDFYNDSDDYYDNSNGGWGNSGNLNIMGVREFNDLKDMLRREWFENNRLTSAKVIVDKNNFTTAQVKELMLLFTFENNRLELAKYAYCKAVDQRNYWSLNDALTFSSSKDELARFLREQSH